MNVQASEFAFGEDEDQQPGSSGQADPAHTAQASETSQAERAAMHPEPHDVEWEYYFGAWSH